MIDYILLDPSNFGGLLLDGMYDINMCMISSIFLVTCRCQYFMSSLYTIIYELLFIHTSLCRSTKIDHIKTILVHKLHTI